MSEERISVAELLARGGGSATPAGGRRRRHAGGENSITVAELTGEIPVIRDGVPADQAQADDQADAASQQPGQQSAEQVTASPAAPQPVEEHDAEPVEVELVEGGQEEDAATSSSLASAVQDVRADADEPSRIDPAKIEYAGYTEHVEAIEVDDEPVEVAEVQEYTEAAGRQAAAQQDAARAVHPSDGTEEDRNFAWSQWTENHPPVMATADFNTALVRERQARLAEAVDQDTVDVAPVTDVPDTATIGPQDTEQPGDAHTDGVIEQLVDDSATPAEKAADVAAEDAAEDAVNEQDDKSGGQSWLVLIAEVVLGLAAGAGLFYGFFKLWNWGGGMPTIALTVVLAFVVVIAIVTFTHYLRKTTDYLTLGLALLVGLVITFGPLLMSLGSN